MIVKNCDKTINLLLINEDSEKNEINNHYVWIKDLSRLLSKQISKDKY